MEHFCTFVDFRYKMGHAIVYFRWLFLFKSTIKSLKKGVLINFTKFTQKHLCQSLFFNNNSEYGHALRSICQSNSVDQKCRKVRNQRNRGRDWSQ